MSSVYGIGNPLMDMVIQVDFEVLKLVNKPPGSMNLVDYEEIEEILKIVGEKARVSAKRVPGGSCANTIRGIAWFKKNWFAKDKSMEIDRLVYSGGVGSDSIGEYYSQLMREYGIHTVMAKKSSPTGMSLILVTPDHERTMFTHLGACREYSKEDTDYSLLGESKYLYFVGFMWDAQSQREAIYSAVKYAKERDVKVCFDLAGPFVVERYREEFLKWIPGNVDILLGNRDEFEGLAGVSGRDEDILDSLAEMAPVAVMKCGEDGCIVGERREEDKEKKLNFHRVPVYRVEALDTTGAGDSFAAGFLFALLCGKDYVEAATLGNSVASRIVMVEGCDYEAVDFKGILKGI